MRVHAAQLFFAAAVLSAAAGNPEDALVPETPLRQAIASGEQPRVIQDVMRSLPGAEREDDLLMGDSEAEAMSALMLKDSTIKERVRAMERDFLEDTSDMRAHGMRAADIESALTRAVKKAISVKNKTGKQKGKPRGTAVKKKAVKKATWKVCAGAEGAYCKCTGHVLYGRKYAAGKPGKGALATVTDMLKAGHKVEKISGSIKCSNGAFGDPLGGYYKRCMCKANVKKRAVKKEAVKMKTVKPATKKKTVKKTVKAVVKSRRRWGSLFITHWKVCADKEGATCKCRGRVLYGRKFKNGRPGKGKLATAAEMLKAGHKIKEARGSITCSNGAFSDPLGGYYKRCMCKADAADWGYH
jgi:hypothetical protein